MVRIPSATLSPDETDTTTGGASGDRSAAARGFLIDETEVTQRQFASFAAATGASQLGVTRVKPDADHPMVGVSYGDARAYCAWVGARLPSEAEWRRVARGDADLRRFPWGDEWAAGLANVAGDGDGFGCTAPVGSFAGGASPFGLLDMIGNAAEWVAEGDSRPDSPVSVADPAAGGRLPDADTHGVCGGSWASAADAARVDRCSAKPGDFPGQWIGLRCAADAPP
jgi:formylglycine-generating enzyme required for sulfatase activity